MSLSQGTAHAASPCINWITDPIIIQTAQCLICSQVYNESTRVPIVANCGHTYCRECMDRGTLHHVFKCFECRAPSCVMNGFKINKALFRGLKAMRLLAEDDTTQAVKVVEAGSSANNKNADHVEQQKWIKMLTTKVIEFLIRDNDIQQSITNVTFLLNHLLTECMDKREHVFDDECYNYMTSMFKLVELNECKTRSPESDDIR